MKNIKKKNIIAVVPARIGSVRVKAKSLRLLAGKPLIYYVIKALKECSIINDIYVNSDSELIGRVANRYDVKFYKRKPELATSDSMIDDYIYDFLKNVSCDVIAVVNPTSPFLSSVEIENSIKHFLDHDFDTQLACEDVRTHCFYKSEAINFTTKGQHPRSQDLLPIKALNFAVTIWNAKKYIKHYDKCGHGIYTGKLGFYPFEGLAAIDIDWEEDFILAQMIMENIDNYRDKTPIYDKVLNDLMESGAKIKN